jgi:hypothetical protein
MLENARESALSGSRGLGPTLRACFREWNYLNVRRINLGFKRILNDA